MGASSAIFVLRLFLSSFFFHFLSVPIWGKWHREVKCDVISSYRRLLKWDIYSMKSQLWFYQGKTLSLTAVFFGEGVFQCECVSVHTCVSVCAGAEPDGVNLCNLIRMISKLILPRSASSRPCEVAGWLRFYTWRPARRLRKLPSEPTECRSEGFPHLEKHLAITCQTKKSDWSDRNQRWNPSYSKTLSFMSWTDLLVCW